MTKDSSYESLRDKTVLIVEDENVVAEALQEALGSVFASAARASNGLEALSFLKEKDFDFILLDLKMPKMNGYDLYAHLRACKPRLASSVIFITGDTETPSAREFIDESGCRHIDKPFLIKDLLGFISGEAPCP